MAHSSSRRIANKLKCISPCYKCHVCNTVYVTKQQHQVWACGSCERPIFKPSLSDVKRHVTACTVVKGISVSPHDSLDRHLLACRRSVGLAWFGDWVDDRFVRTHAKRTHTQTHTPKPKKARTHGHAISQMRAHVQGREHAQRHALFCMGTVYVMIGVSKTSCIQYISVPHWKKQTMNSPVWHHVIMNIWSLRLPGPKGI